ncbi:grpE protein homolog 2, mitochondrial [Pelobates fuscus]|uniref:grpE protein homolog 2, mitochondrial n=1 Tax=Pelobates fuscus TaxID=191477 RepID=UPI002FE4B7F8
MFLARVRTRAAADQLGVLLTYSSRQGRNLLCAFSAANQQRYAGDHTTTGDGTTGDQIKSVAMMSLEKKALKLEEQVQDLKERNRITMADSENVRKRTQKYVMDAKLFGIQSFCRDLVELADLVEDAVAQAAKDGLNDMTEVLSQVDGKLQSIFTKHGLEKMNPMGSTFDPYEHEVVCHVPAEGRTLGTVAMIKQDGYKLHGRTIRHAHVGLAVESPE